MKYLLYPALNSLSSIHFNARLIFGHSTGISRLWFSLCIAAVAVGPIANSWLIMPPAFNVANVSALSFSSIISTAHHSTNNRGFGGTWIQLAPRGLALDIAGALSPDTVSRGRSWFPDGARSTLAAKGPTDGARESHAIHQVHPRACYNAICWFSRHTKSLLSFSHPLEWLSTMGPHRRWRNQRVELLCRGAVRSPRCLPLALSETPI